MDEEMTEKEREKLKMKNFEKAQSYVRMDMKGGKYQDKFTGKVGAYKKFYLPNGRAKSFYKRDQNEDQLLQTNNEKMKEEIDGIEEFGEGEEPKFEQKYDIQLKHL